MRLIEKWREFFFRYGLAVSLVVILISIYFLGIADSGYIGFDLLLTNLKGRVPISLILIVFMFFLRIGRDCFTAKGFFKGFLSGWPLLLVGLLYFIVLLLGMDWDAYFHGINAVAIFAVIFDMFCTGLFEEILMRGVVFQILAQKWGYDRSGMMKSFLVSSISFGLVHLFNYSPGLLISTVSQVIFTTFIGMFLCSVFLCSGRNIWVVIALHAVFDFITLILQQEFTYSVATGGQVVDMSILMGVIIVAATLPLGWLGVVKVYKRSILL